MSSPAEDAAREFGPVDDQDYTPEELAVFALQDKERAEREAQGEQDSVRELVDDLIDQRGGFSVDDLRRWSVNLSDDDLGRLLQGVAKERPVVSARAHARAPVEARAALRADEILADRRAREIADEREAEAAGLGAVPEQFPRLDAVALLDPERPPRRWLWDQLIPLGDQASIIAPGGTGKSLLVLALCTALLRDDGKFIGLPVDFDGKILYIDMENSEDDWSERLTDLGWTQESIAAVADRFIPLSLPSLRGLDTRTGAEQLKAVVAHYGVGAGDLLVLDSTQRVTEGPENEADTLRALYSHTSLWLKAEGITVIRTDNTGKDTEKGARGSSAKNDDIGYGLTLEPVGRAKDTFRLRSTKRRGRGDSDGFTFIRGTDAAGHLCFTQPVAEDAVREFGLATHQKDTLLKVWTLTDPADPRYESDLVSQDRCLRGVPGKSDLKRNGLEALVNDGFLEKVPYVNADGSESRRSPGITITGEGRAWIEENRDWAEGRLDELAQIEEK